MHKVVLKGKEAVSVKCSSCKTAHEVQSNRHSHPVTMAFTHPKQAIAAKCRACEKDFSWSPEELTRQLLTEPPKSFSAPELMTAHMEATAIA